MGEVPSRAANGLTVKGVTFTAAGTVLFNTTGPGIQRFVQAPCLVGNSGTSLTMDFPGEVSNLSLGVAISAGGSLTPGFRVELFNGGTSLGIFPVNTATFFTFT